MTLFLDDGDLTLYHGDAITVLQSLPSGIAQTCVTSPPYWGLRDYNAPGQLGLEATPTQYVERLVSVFREVRRVLRDDGTLWLNLAASFMSGDGARLGARNGGKPDTAPQDSRDPGSAYPDLCGECAAALSIHTERSSQPHPVDASLPTPTTRGNAPLGSARASRGALPLGAPVSTSPISEPLPLGECSHCSNCGVCLAVLGSSSRDARLCVRRAESRSDTSSPSSGGYSQGMDAEGTAWLKYISGKLKPKDQAPIPWMVVMAMIADGWYFRGDIIWAKANCMPESVTDRPTRSHEFVFLFSKQPRYFYDADAIREPATYAGKEITLGLKSLSRGQATGAGIEASGNGKADSVIVADGRNRRSVWVIPTEPFPEAHFATYPQELVRPCIQAGTSERGGCGECGAPWRRVVSERPYPADLANAKKAHGGIGNNLGGQRHQEWLDANPRETTGWEPTCDHPFYTDATVRPQLVLDPFIGSGTTALAARKHGRRCIGIDLSTEYLAIAAKRTRQLSLLGGTP